MNEQPVLYKNYIAGSWVEGEGTIPVTNKFTGDTYAYVYQTARDQVTEAVTSAKETFEKDTLTPTDRYHILFKAGDIMKERKEELAQVMVAEVGKTINDARTEIDRGINTLVVSAEEAKRISGTGIPIQGEQGNEGKISYTMRVPVGVVGAITPFNFPFNLTIHKLGPALAAGNTVVLKPAEVTPVIAMKIAEILEEAGLPKGYLQVVNGYGKDTGQYLLEDKRIAKYTFTGSAGVGKHIKAVTGIRKVTLELGNNSPNIVHHDVKDLDRAVELCTTRAIANAGQACISVQRIFVHEDRYDEFVEKAKDRVEKFVVGDPSDEATNIGPLISEDAAKRVEAWVQEAESQGASVVTGGKRDGSLYYPTILADVTPDMKVMCEEVFAPVMNIVKYSDIDEAFREANASDFGLQVGVFTADLDLAMKATKKLEFGGVIINNVSTFRADIMPYGGVKDSGLGKEGPKYAIEELTDERLVVIDS